VRVPVGEVAVLEGGGFGFVEVHGEVAGVDVLGEEGPFDATGEASAAAAAEAGILHELDDVRLGHGLSLAECGIAAGGDVVVVTDELALGSVSRDAFEEDGSGVCHEYLVRVFLVWAYCSGEFGAANPWSRARESL